MVFFQMTGRDGRTFMDLKKQTIETYNESVGALAKKFANFGPRVKDVKRGFSYVQKGNPSVLEIGCGYGREAGEILKLTDQYLGIDISGEMIKMARGKVPNGNFTVADIEDYIFPKHLDIIFSFASLLHSDKEHLQSILNRAYEALNQGGIFYISSKYDKYHSEVQNDEFGTRVYYYYTPDDIKKLDTRYTVVWEDKHEHGGQNWFTIILKK